MRPYRTRLSAVTTTTTSLGCAVLTLCAVTMSSQTVEASWAYVPQEIRMAEADLIVAGTVEKMGEDVEKKGAVYETGIIKASVFLRGKAKANNVIRLAWPKRNPGGLRLSTDLPAPKVGESSIWVMQADEKLPVYWATYPTDRQPMDKLDEMKKKMATLKKTQWSEPKDGLYVGVFIERRDMRKSKTLVNGKPVKALAQMSAYTMFWNSTDKSVQLVSYPYDDQFTIELTDPDGQPIQVQTTVTPPQKPPIRKHNFVEVRPRRVRTIGYGFQLGMATKPGEYTLKLHYKNARDGKNFGFENVWKGETSTPDVKFTVAK